MAKSTFVQKLSDAKKDMKAGNHQVRFVYDITGNHLYGRDFVYFKTIICGVNDRNKTFYTDSSYGSMSTTHAVNAYRRHFKELGYTEINVQTGQAV